MSPQGYMFLIAMAMVLTSIVTIFAMKYFAVRKGGEDAKAQSAQLDQVLDGIAMLQRDVKDMQGQVSDVDQRLRSVETLLKEV